MHPATVALVLIVRSYDIFGVSAGNLGVAKRTAAGILRRAGIELLWVDCAASSVSPAAPACRDVIRADELLVRIIAAPIGDRRPTTDRDTLGHAYVDTVARGGALATLYADRIAVMASKSSVDEATLLGRAMAHEIGHLLLGTPTHSLQGLMRAEWSPALLQRRIGNDWQFSPGELESLAKNLELRITSPPASP